MRQLVGPGCDVTAGNSLTHLFDAVGNDPRQMGPKGPMDPLLGPRGMMDPASSSMDAAWGAPMGMSMPDQMRAHMQRQQPGLSPEFYDMQARGPNWANEFQVQGPPVMGPMGPMGPMAAPNEMWAQEFRAQQASMPMPHVAEQSMPPSAHLAGPMMPPIGMLPMAPNMHWMGPQQAMPMPDQRLEQRIEPLQEAVAQQPTQSADLAQASQMVEMLKTSGNPKFANSAFVKFIDRVSKGDLTFQDNKVVDASGNELDWDAIYDAEVGQSSHNDVAELDRIWKDAGAASSSSMEAAWRESLLDGMWDGNNLSGDLSQWNQQLENVWNDEAMADLQQAWGGDGNLDGIWNQISTPQDNTVSYGFATDNPYVDEENPMELAQRLIAEGKDREAISALEVEVQRNPESSEGWRQLGQLWAQMDQDVEAIQCLRRGHEADPYNLDSLLALGVSCTNELDQVEALKYLRSWIANHDDFADLMRGMPEPAFQDMELLRDQVTNLFNAASDLHPNDPDVFVALGVIENINRNYGAAAMALAQACRLRPDDFTSWNKLGATLANSGKSEDALIAYHQALSLKPNYARTWANLAIAHANMGEHVDAARFYLSSLTLNPAATHIWTFLHTAMLNAGKFDPAITERNLEACKQLVPGSLDLDSMPLPMATLAEPADEILRRIEI